MHDILMTPLRLSELETLVTNCVRKALAEQDFTPARSGPDVVGIDGACEVTGLAKQTIYGHVSNRTIPHSKRGGRLYFSRSALENWMLSGGRKTVAEIAETV